MKCPKCESTMKKIVGDHLYRESGMDHVILRNIAQYVCEEDGSAFVQIPAIAQLHRTLALAIAEKRARMIPSEVRFLRDHLGVSNTQFAELMGVTPTQSSRWTTSETIGLQAERLLRLLVAFGPERVKAATEATLFVSSATTQKARAQVAEETLGDVANVIHRLLSSSPEARAVEIGLRRSGTGWKQDAALTN